MMMNLFLSFDPSTLMWNLNWLSSFLGLMFIPITFWLIPSRLNLLWITLNQTLYKEFFILMPLSLNKGSTLIFISLFSIIMFNNFLGLYPYIFTSSSHMIMNLSLALSLWLTFMIYGWTINFNHMFTHLVPQGTPPILMSLMVCIETISNIIRPSTLAIRLTANVIAGHLLMTLLSNMGSYLSMKMMIFMILIQILLITLEMAVAIIQSYVFSILSILYSSEISYE
uniref:ATP synthase subunit a n=1 Tax=Lucifotychus sp. 1 EF-2015 TaxID=1756870 RepID=A0A0S2M7S6_9COLE|nr:ATP synthase F0 subunit 6 [Lucifotychus sp. 1 EF-2015]